MKLCCVRAVLKFRLNPVNEVRAHEVETDGHCIAFYVLIPLMKSGRMKLQIALWQFAICFSLNPVNEVRAHEESLSLLGLSLDCLNPVNEVRAHEANIWLFQFPALAS